MLNVTKRWTKETTEWVDFVMSESFDPNLFKDMDARQFNLFKKTYSLLMTSIEMCEKQAETIDEMNKKLDKLVSIANKLEA